eukprot:TRINITY_DN9928_c0_g1_i1.p1 TRINITY_DN9928_c0_g1~~TRINITY_DN9928_c0_g1_i1.p1  ORF type:complete len:230 (-),score=9.41 TRINITY_DN9928_c0_g1_i1:72-761(-)
MTLAQNSKNLQSLVVEGCDGLSSECFKKVFHARLVFANLHKLKLKGCLQLEEGIKYVPLTCVALKELAVPENLNITHLLSLHSIQHSLQMLDLRYCSQIGAEGIRRLFSSNSKDTEQGFDELVSISCSHCSQVSDGAIEILGERCTALEKVDFSECQALTGEAIRHLVPCKKLANVNLSGCAVCADDIALLLSSCTNIKILNLGSCEHITITDVEGLRTKFAQAQILWN